MLYYLKQYTSGQIQDLEQSCLAMQRIEATRKRESYWQRCMASDTKSLQGTSTMLIMASQSAMRTVLKWEACSENCLNWNNSKFLNASNHQTSQREFHHFSNASSQGYGAVSYLQQININGKNHCSLIIAKSRLAPLNNDDSENGITCNHQETFSNGTIGKRSPFIKEALRFVQLVQMESSSVH